MGTYYYLKDKQSKEGFLPVYEDDYIQALYSIVKKHGLKISDKMILEELKGKKKLRGSKNRCTILIDGSNFYFKLKDLKLHNLLEFDFSGFAKKLAGKDKIVSITYYVGKIRTDGTEKTKKLFDDQQRLLGHLKKHKVKYAFGYLMRSDSKYHEKGVDVNVAVDMLVGAYENLCDRIILVSSDTDLLPAVIKVRQKGKIVEYVGFSHKPSVAMVATCSVSTLVKREDVKLFLKSKKNP